MKERQNNIIDFKSSFNLFLTSVRYYTLLTFCKVLIVVYEETYTFIQIKK